MKPSFFVLLFAFFGAKFAHSQCNPFLPDALSPRPTYYDINVTLDDQRKTLDAVQVLRFKNTSPEPINELRIYLYFNAFKNTESSFLRGTSQIFGQGFSDRNANEWAWVDIQQFNRELEDSSQVELHQNMRFIQLDDGNQADQSVLELPLDKAIMPGETAVFKLKWRAQIPRTIARAGYNRDFFFLCHWFPQLGVFEQDNNGKWGWNCHQFFRHNEFYADFGVYDVRITLAENFKMGASGCLVSEKNNGNGTVTRHYHAEDVIDFAWSAYPYFQVWEDRWQDVYIRLMLPPEHAAMGPRYLYAMKFALQYLDKHVGKYPYPSITVIDPPFHGLRSGLMEYPTLITVGTFYGMPKNIRTSESLLVHEFVHQYFMGILASNEKEEPWLDEGFVTYFEDRIIDAAFGQKCSLVDIWGYRFGNRELSRTEYSTMHNPRDGIIARPGWDFSDNNFKALIYSKTASSLHTLQSLVGDEKMDKIIQSYFNQWKFKHPRGKDFMSLLRTELMANTDSTRASELYNFFETCIYRAEVLDYAVAGISNEYIIPPQGVYGRNDQELKYKDGNASPSLISKISLKRLGEWVFPVEILVSFEDGSSETYHWDGIEGEKNLEITGKPKVVSAQIDPNLKMGMDVDLNNNSMTLQPQTAPLWKYTAKAIFWIQNLMQVASFLA